MSICCTTYTTLIGVVNIMGQNASLRPKCTSAGAAGFSEKVTEVQVHAWLSQ